MSDCNNRVLVCEVRTYKVDLFLAYATCVLPDWTCCFFYHFTLSTLPEKDLHICIVFCFADSYLQLLSKLSKHQQKKSPFLEFHHFGIDKQVKKAAKRKQELEEVNSHWCVHATDSKLCLWHSDIASQKRERVEWSERLRGCSFNWKAYWDLRQLRQRMHPFSAQWHWLKVVYKVALLKWQGNLILLCTMILLHWFTMGRI